ncbi:MAG: NAD(P)-binding protein [Spirochaetaceae bacterium]|nr:NAD(P)-binding protein [Spirochaetaceae bacterium]
MKIVIIGGGMAGLAAGIYAQIAGFESVIYEKYRTLGGQCTGWDRNGYRIDSCISLMGGTKEGTGFNKMWKEFGVIRKEDDIIRPDSFGTAEFNGVSITLWKNLDRLRTELLAISPEDEKPIENLIQNCRLMGDISMVVPVDKPVDMMSPGDLLKVLKALLGAGGILTKNSKTSFAEYAARFKHPALQKLILSRLPPYFSILGFFFTIGTFASGNGDLPRGGSRTLPDRMSEKYLALGGRIHTGSAAEEIIVRGNRAVGVRFTANGERFTAEADYVIAACDVHITLTKLLKNQYRDRRFELRYRNSRDYPVFSTFHAAFGIQRDLTAYPISLIFEVEPLTVGLTEYPFIKFRNYSYDQDFAPPGCSVITVPLNQSGEDYRFWEDLYRRDIEGYRREKQRIGEELRARLVRRFPEWEGKIQLLDVATPLSYHHYTGAWQGAWMSFMMTPKAKLLIHSGKIRGLKNCLLTGQWLQPPGGVPTAIMNGRFTIQRICKMEKRPLLPPLGGD